MAAKTYEGTPCRREGHTTRYVSGGDCVSCSNDGRLRANRLLREYGITPADEQALWDASGGQCPVCNKDMARTGPISSTRAVIDHCHSSGRVRSIICNGCNRGLGYFGDNPDALRSAALYLETHAN